MSDGDSPAPVAPPPPPDNLPLPADTTGLYGLGGLACMALAITGLVYVFTGSPNRFIQTLLLPHFYRFGIWAELGLMAMGVYIGYRHVARLAWKHRLLRWVLLCVAVVSLWMQWQLQAIWLAH